MAGAKAKVPIGALEGITFAPFAAWEEAMKLATKTDDIAQMIDKAEDVLEGATKGSKGFANTEEFGTLKGSKGVGTNASPTGTLDEILERELNAIVDVPVEKFQDYIFKDGATHGKNVIYEDLGYGKNDSEYLVNLYKKQAMKKYESGEYTLGKLDQYGQRITIEIELKGIGKSSDKISYLKSGWMIESDGSISLNIPFSGFSR